MSIETTRMTPYEATIAGLDAGAASVHIEMDNGTLKVFHGTDGALLMHVTESRDGTWDQMWKGLRESGKIKYRA